MKQFLIGLVAVLALSTLVGFSLVSVKAADEGPTVLTDSQIEDIRDRCLASKVTLNTLHSTDALLRVNLGQQYENISARLMAPFNSRIALNSYDSVELVQTTVDFNQALDTFRSEYRSYESSVDTALDIDCRQRPVDYYSAIENARQRRSDLYEATRQVNQLAGQYLDRFDTFAAEVLKEKAD